MTGNEAFARGAWEAGVKVGAAYPGTPSTEIMESLATYPAGDVAAQWSTNEKVACEVAIGAAITVGVRRGGLLLSILVLPLYIPTLILGARAVEQALLDLSPWPALGLLAALTLFSAALAPFAAAAALRINTR